MRTYIYTFKLAFILAFITGPAFAQSQPKIRILFNNFTNEGAKNSYASLSHLLPNALSLPFESDSNITVFDINKIRLTEFIRKKKDAVWTEADLFFINDIYTVNDTSQLKKTLLANNINYFVSGRFTSFEDKLKITVTPYLFRNNSFSKLSEISSGFISYTQIYSNLDELSLRLKDSISTNFSGVSKLHIAFSCASPTGARNEAVESTLNEIAGYLPEYCKKNPALVNYAFVSYDKVKDYCNRPPVEIMKMTMPQLESIIRTDYLYLEGSDSVKVSLNFFLKNFNDNKPLEIDRITVPKTEMYELVYKFLLSSINFLSASIADTAWNLNFLDYIKTNDRSRLLDAGQKYLTNNNLSAAAVCFSKAAAIDSADVKVLNGLAYTRYRQNLNYESFSLYAQSLKKDSINNNDAIAGLGNVYFQQGDYFSAYRQFSNPKLKEHRYPEAHLLLGKTYLFLDSLKEAKIELKTAFAQNPDCFDCHFLLGQVYEALGNNDSAIFCYTKAIRIDKRKTEAGNHLANLFIRMGDNYFFDKKYDKGLPYYIKADSLQRSILTLDRMRLTLNYLRKFDEADTIVTLLYKNNFYQQDSIYLLQATALSQVTDTDGSPAVPGILKSNFYLEEYVKRTHDTSRAVTSFGVNYFNLHDTTNTLKYYRLATVMDSRNVYSYLNLAEFLITTCDTSNVREALNLSEKALDLLRKRPADQNQYNREDELVAYYLSEMARKILKMKTVYKAKIDALNNNVGTIEIWSFTTFDLFLKSNNCRYPAATRDYLVKLTEKLKANTQLN